MKIVIDIDEDYYEIVKNNDCFKPYNIIANGIPLPKNHGRLIDADELEECKDIMKPLAGAYRYAVRMDDIRNAHTIIEADKEKEE